MFTGSKISNVGGRLIQHFLNVVQNGKNLMGCRTIITESLHVLIRSLYCRNIEDKSNKKMHFLNFIKIKLEA